MNFSHLFNLTVTGLFALGCYSQIPVLHAYENFEDLPLNYAEYFQGLKITSQTDLDLSLPADSFMKIAQKNEGVLQPDLQLPPVVVLVKPTGNSHIP